MSFPEEKVARVVAHLLELFGEDADREGLRKTPQRVASVWQEFTRGYRENPEDIVAGAIFEVDGYQEIILVRDIEYFSLCEHHLLPFFGKAFVGYIPRKKIIGLSKIPRIVDHFSKRLQVQERMTWQIAEFLDRILSPLGVAVVLEGYHLCLAMRGVRKSQARMQTSALLGVFREDARTRAEFFSLISG